MVSSVLARVERYTIKGPDCWTFKLTANCDGYPVIWFETDWIKVARLLIEIHEGPLTTTDYACHACNNVLCVRYSPGHVYKGSATTNARDRIRAGTASKLTTEDVLEIRRLMLGRPRDMASKLAVVYHCHVQTIYAVHYRRSWAWLQ